MKVEISIHKDRIRLVSDHATPGLGKRIAGANFSSVGGSHWSIPLTLDSCYKLREEFGTDLRVGRDVSEWAREAITRQAVMGDLGRARDADLVSVPAVSPVLAEAMSTRTYQRVGARFVAEGWERGGVLIADQPGLGKTLEALGGLMEAGAVGPFLILCPKTAVLSVWSREIPRWWPDARAIPLPDGREKRNSILNAYARDWERGLKMDRTFIITNKEMARTKSWWVCKSCGHRMKWKAGPKTFECACGFDVLNKPEGKRVDEHEYPQLFRIAWGAIVADESDQMLLRLSGTPTQMRAGAELLRVAPNGAKIAMSGTPDRSRPHLLWGTLNWLFPNEYPAFWRWAETYYEVHPTGWGASRTLGSFRDDKLDQFGREMDSLMLRRTKDEVAPDLPPKTYVGSPLHDGGPRSPIAVWLPMDPAQQRLYDQMEKESMVLLAGGDLNAIGVLAEMTRLKQFANSSGDVEEKMVKGEATSHFIPKMPSNKLEYVWDYLGELGYPDAPITKVVIASQFTGFLTAMTRELSRRLGKHAEHIGIVSVTGEVTGARRDRVIEEFNRSVGSGPHIMMINTKAGGVAITLDTADHMFICDRTWVPADQEQLEDRIHRVSRPRPVFYHYLASVGSIEEAIAEVNAEREAESREVLDGRRGVEYARRVVEAMKR